AAITKNYSDFVTFLGYKKIVDNKLYNFVFDEEYYLSIINKYQQYNYKTLKECLFDCCALGITYVVEYFILNDYFDIFTLKDGYSLLYTSVLNTDNTDMVKLILKYLKLSEKPILEHMNLKIDGKPIINYVCDKQFTNILSVLLQEPLINVNEKDNKHNTPLMITVLGYNVTNICMLLNDIRVDPNIKNLKGNTAFHLVIHKKYTQVCDLFLNNSRVNKNIQNNHGETPLFVSANNGSRKIFYMIYNTKGVDTNIKDYRKEKTPLEVHEENPREIIFIRGKPFIKVENKKNTYNSMLRKNLKV
ncbi:MAG: ankyrin repeat domain-containing protein, partial [Cyclobacteriaceae bacterium]